MKFALLLLAASTTLVAAIAPGCACDNHHPCNDYGQHGSCDGCSCIYNLEPPDDGHRGGWKRRWEQF
jgi:hypothetical protein